MKAASEIILPEDCKYTAEHIWLRKDGDGWHIGVTDFAQDQLGEVVFVDLPTRGEAFAAGSEFGTVESLKSVSPLYMPVAGTVTEVNADLEATPSLVNADCYGKAWMLRLRAADNTAVEALLCAEAYRTVITT